LARRRHLWFRSKCDPAPIAASARCAAATAGVFVGGRRGVRRVCGRAGRCAAWLVAGMLTISTSQSLNDEAPAAVGRLPGLGDAEFLDEAVTADASQVNAGSTEGSQTAATAGAESADMAL
jgi:hypothetical protein